MAEAITQNSKLKTPSFPSVSLSLLGQDADDFAGIGTG